MKKLIISTLIITSIYGAVITNPSNIKVNPIVEVQAASVKLSTTSKILAKGQSYTLKVKNAKKKVTWSSSNKKIATVTSKGKVTAKKAGIAYIYAKVSGKKLKCKIKVESPTLSTTYKTIYWDSTSKLTVKNTTQKVTWSSSNKKVATVSSNGTVKGIKVGQAYIYAKVGGKTLRCTLNVQKHTHDWEAIYGKKYDLDIKTVYGCSLCGYPLFIRNSDCARFIDDLCSHNKYYMGSNFTRSKKNDGYCYGSVIHPEKYTKGYCGYCGDLIEYRFCESKEFSKYCRKNMSNGKYVKVKQGSGEYSYVSVMYYHECKCGKNQIMIDGETEKGLVITGYQCIQCGKKK